MSPFFSAMLREITSQTPSDPGPDMEVIQFLCGLGFTDADDSLLQRIEQQLQEIPPDLQARIFAKISRIDALRFHPPLRELPLHQAIHEWLRLTMVGNV